MTATNTFHEVRNIASDIFGIPTAKLDAESSPESVESWDSVKHLNLVLALEERFAVEFAPEEIEKMKTLGATAAMLDSKLAASGASR